MGAKLSYSFDQCITAIDVDEKTFHAINLNNVENITHDSTNNIFFYFVIGKKITVLKNSIKHLNAMNLNQLVRCV